MKGLVIFVCLFAAVLAGEGMPEECKSHFRKAKDELTKMLTEGTLPTCANKECIEKWLGVGMTNEERREARREMMKKWKEMTEDERNDIKSCNLEIKSMVFEKVGNPSEDCVNWVKEHKNRKAEMAPIPAE